MLVELNNGDTFCGHLVKCDTWMHVTVKEVFQTSPEGDRFFRLTEAYVRGNNVTYSIGEREDRSNQSQIKYLRMPEELPIRSRNQKNPESTTGGPERSR